jgi:hypothetical protein
VDSLKQEKTEMKTIRLTVVLCFVLGLAGVFPGAHLTFAQSDDVCARPDGLPAPPMDWEL